MKKLLSENNHKRGSN